MWLRLARYALWLAAAAVGILFLLTVLYFARGSLEEFPTAEDTSKVRTVAGVGSVVLLGVELALVVLLRRVTAAARQRAGTGSGPPAA